MSNVSGFFTSVGAISAPAYDNAAGDVPYSIGGTFVGTVVIERAIAGNLTAWEPLPSVGPISAPVTGVIRGGATGIHRFRCTSFTSGTILYSITPTPAAVTPPPSLSVAQIQAALNNLGSVGGVPLGSAGRAGSAQAGYQLVWGDDFLETSPSMISPTTPNAKYAPWYTNPINRPASNTHAISYVNSYPTNPNDTGWNDVNRGFQQQATGDIVTQANSMLTLVCRKFSASNEWQWTDIALSMLGACISAAPLVCAQPPMIMESRMRLRTVNPNGVTAGNFSATWSNQVGPMQVGNNIEIDWPDSDGGTTFIPRGNLWNNGSGVGTATDTVVGNQPTASTYDGLWHVWTAVYHPTTGVDAYCDGVLLGTIPINMSTYGPRPSYPLFSNLSEGAVSAWSATAPNIAVLDLDWWRIWVPTGSTLRTAQSQPVLAVSGATMSPSGEILATVGVPFSITLPSTAAMWGSANVLDTVEAMPTSVRAPGGLVTGMFSMWPPMVSYDPVANIISGIVYDQPGEMWVVRTGTAAGDACMVSRFRVCFAPRILTPATGISMVVGQAFTYDMYRDMDVGNLLPLTVTATGLPPGLTMFTTGALIGRIQGTPTATSTATITLTNCVGQSVTQSVPFYVATAGSGSACPYMPAYVSLAAAGLVGSIDPDKSSSVTLASGTFGSGGVISAIAGADGTTPAAVQNTSANRPTSATSRGRAVLATTVAGSQYLDWTSLVTAAGSSVVSDQYTILVVATVSTSGSSGALIEIANGAAAANAGRVGLWWNPAGYGHVCGPTNIVYDTAPGTATHLFTLRRLPSGATGLQTAALLNLDKYTRAYGTQSTAQVAPGALTTATLGAATISSTVGNYVNAYIWRVLVFNRALEPYEHNIIAAWAAATYGTA